MDYTRNVPTQSENLLDDGTTVTEYTDQNSNKQVMPAHGDRMPAFYGLAKASGGIYAENADGRNPQEMLEAAGMNFTVEFLDAVGGTVIDPSGVEQLTWDGIRGTFATWPAGPDGTRRPRRPLGMVKSKYKICQPEELAAFGQAILDESGATCVAAGQYGRPMGTRCYLAFKLPEGLKVRGQDAYDLYLTAGTSYDGSTSTWGTIAPLRIDCTNQIPMIFRNASTRFIFRHTGNVQEKFVDARNFLKITNTWTEKYQAWCEKALNTPVSTSDVHEYVTKLLPTPTTVGNRGVDAWVSRRTAAMNVITNSPTNRFGEGTAYGMYQGFVEWAQFHAPVRGNDDVRRYVRIMDGGEQENLLQRAGNLLALV